MVGIDDDAAGPKQRQPELTPMERVEQKLVACGVPEEQLQEHQEGLLMYLEEHRDRLSEITSAILSAGTEARKSSKKDDNSSSGSEGRDGAYGESLSWLQWMMFNNKPDAMLDDMEAGCTEERAVCGSIWGQNDLAYSLQATELSASAGSRSGHGGGMTWSVRVEESVGAESAGRAGDADPPSSPLLPSLQAPELSASAGRKKRAWGRRDLVGAGGGVRRR